MNAQVKPKLLVFASGSEKGGGSGFANLVKHARAPWRQLSCDIVGVVSNHEHGGVAEYAHKFDVPFIYFKGPWNKSEYQHIVSETGAEWVALSGWLRHTSGLDPTRTFNIHPAPLSLLGGRFGGEGMYGMHVHRAVHAALQNKEIDHSGISMHFVTEEFDEGPVFFEHPVKLDTRMSAEMIQKKVNTAEHHWQPRITNMVIHGKISWNGKNAESLTVPDGYQFLPQ